MSAIAGIYHFNDEPINLEHGNRMMKELEKYPADDVQTWHNDKVYLGCHAQWITPESIGENLPYYDTERKLAITADAIIDNREELFEKLQVKKDRRKHITDSELILLSYYKWGEDSPKYLVGDFAFMIWDERNHKLFGARDFSGSRTLYYCLNNNKLAFSTVIHPLLSLPYIRAELNEQWIAEYLAVSGMIDAVDSKITPYKNIQQIPPSHSIVVGREIKLNRYCTLNREKKLKLKSDGEYVEAFQDVFQIAVNSRLRTHRDIGSQLSGGLDSGAVTSFAAKSLDPGKKLHTFSYIPPKDFNDFTPKYLLADERPFIHSTVDYIGGLEDHYLDFEGKNSYQEINDLLDVIEMPYKFFENSFWLKGMFEAAEKEGIAVLLNGDRGNFSVSWGFADDYFALLLKKLRWFQLYQELNQYAKKVGGPRLRRIPELVKIGFPVIERIFSNESSNNNPSIINPEFAKRTSIYEKLREYGINQTGWFPTSNIYEERKRHFDQVFMWNAGNTLSSKLSLRHSIVKRDPTNDIRVIRYCLSVPENQYVQNGLDRALIRRATQNYLPDKVRLNQHIRGVQGADWVHRMIPNWSSFLNEIQVMVDDKEFLTFIDAQVLKNAYFIAKEGPRPEFAIKREYKILMRSIILHRYIKQNFSTEGR